MLNDTENNMISVYIPTYNRLEYLMRAVDSVLSQNYPKKEIIIVDDNSTDGTWDYLKALEKKYSYVVVIKKPSDLLRGPQVSRNIAIETAKGKYITGLDDDDFFGPDRLIKMMKAYNEKYAFVCSNYYNFKNGKGSVSSYRSRKIKFSHLLEYNCVGNQIFTETYKLKAIGGFDEKLVALQDLDMWLRLTKKYGHALRIRDATYFQDFDDGIDRITFSEKKRIGTFQFFEKYKDYLREDVLQKRSLLLNGSLSLTHKLKSYSFRMILLGILIRLKIG